MERFFTFAAAAVVVFQAHAQGPAQKQFDQLCEFNGEDRAVPTGLLSDAVEMLERISTTVRRVLVESGEVAGLESAALRRQMQPKLG